MEEYPVSSPMRPCPPVTFMLHLPFTFFDLHTADVLFFIYNTFLLLGLAAFAIKIHQREKAPEKAPFPWTIWLLVSCLLLVSRPGHISLFTGYFTVELVLGTLIALHFASSRPWLSAMGMLIASSKPTFILPLMLLMLARRNFRAVMLGLVLCTVAGIAGLGWLATASDIGDVIHGISEGMEEFHDDETEYPVNTWTRVDLVGMFAKMIDWIPTNTHYLIGMFLLMIPSCIGIQRIAKSENDTGAGGLSAAIALLTILLAIYHHSYDCMLALVPLVGVAFFADDALPSMSRQSKWFLACLLAVPFVNYLSTQSARNLLKLEQTDFVWQAFTLINGISLLAALVLLLFACFRHTNSSNPEFGFDHDR